MTREVIPIDADYLEEIFEMAEEIKADGSYVAMTEDQIADAVRERHANASFFNPDLMGGRALTYRGLKIAVIEESHAVAEQLLADPEVKAAIGRSVLEKATEFFKDTTPKP